MLRGLYTGKILEPNLTSHTITALLSRTSLNTEQKNLLTTFLIEGINLNLSVPQLTKHHKFPDIQHYRIKHRNDRVPFVVTYNPNLRQIPTILHKCFPILQSSSRCSKIFAKSPLTAYRRPKNLHYYLVGSTISASTTEQTHINTSKGFHKCNTPNCKTCPYIANNTQTYTFHNTSYEGKIRNKYTCSTNHLIYLIQCKRCSKSKQPTDCQYIKQTGRILRERFGEHRTDITNDQHEKSGVAPLETIRNRRESLQRARKQQLTIKASTITPSNINRITDQ